ncbi:DNA polymerase epsilon catalytic subunit A, partial [Schistosoma japonicum]
MKREKNKKLEKAVLCRSVFLKLVDELRHFHVDVIYANFSRLIISTHRIELPEALARIDYFTQLIRTRRGTLFTHMDLQYVTSWRHLIWMDSAITLGVKACVESLVDGKDVEWSGVLTTQHSSDPPTEKESNVEQHYPPDPELDMHWHLARYLPEARGLRSKFQSLLAGYLLAIYNIVRTEHRRLVESTITNSSNELHDCRFEFIGNVSEVSNFVHKAETTPYKSDATVSPGVREYEERLFKEQLAPELYNLIIRLQRKAAWINPDLVKKGGLSISNNDIFQVNRDVNIHKNNEIVSAYLADKPIGLHAEFDVSDNNKSANLNLIPPLLPTHQSIYTLNFTPLLDFIKSFCEIISLEPSTKLQIKGIRRDLLLYLPEVACPTCNFTRDIDVCRDVHIVWIMNSVNVKTGQSGHWSWICPHCRTFYPRAKLEEALVRQLEQFSLQHCLQDLQCSKCVVGGGIQELLLANGGSVAQCSECSTKLILSVLTGNAVYRRLDVYRNISIHFAGVGFIVFIILISLHISPAIVSYVIHLFHCLNIESVPSVLRFCLSLTYLHSSGFPNYSVIVNRNIFTFDLNHPTLQPNCYAFTNGLIFHILASLPDRLLALIPEPNETHT